MISSGISSSLLKLVGIVVFFLVFKGVSLTNAAELRIGVTYLSAPNPSLSIIQKTTDYLNTHLVDGVRLQFYEIRELEEAIRKHEVDLVLSGAGFYRRLHDHGLRILATLVTDRGPDPDHSNGSAMIVLASRSDLKTLEDLRGKTLAATVANGFQGYQIGMQRLNRIHLNFLDVLSLLASRQVLICVRLLMLSWMDVLMWVSSRPAISRTS